MNENIKLDKNSLAIILTNLFVVKMIFAFPREMFKISGNAAWIEAIYLVLVAFVLLEITFMSYKFTGNRSIIQLAEAIGGNFLKIIVALLVTVVLGGFLCTEVRTFAESVKIILLPSTRIEVVMLVFAITAGIGAYYGIEPLSIICGIFFPFCLVFLVFLVMWLVPNFEINNIMPIFGLGARKIFVSGLKNLSCFSDILALNLLLPYCNDIDAAKKGGRKALLISGAVLIMITLAYGLCYPYPHSSDFLLTAYQLSRMVRAGEYFQRFEALFELVWTDTHLLYSSIYIYIICSVLKDGFKLRYTKPIIPCVVTILAMISFEPSSVVDLLSVTSLIKQIFFPFAYLLPIAIPLIYAFKRRKHNE